MTRPNHITLRSSASTTPIRPNDLSQNRPWHAPPSGSPGLPQRDQLFAEHLRSGPVTRWGLFSLVRRAQPSPSAQPPDPRWHLRRAAHHRHGASLGHAMRASRSDDRIGLECRRRGGRRYVVPGTALGAVGDGGHYAHPITRTAPSVLVPGGPTAVARPSRPGCQR